VWFFDEAEKVVRLSHCRKCRKPIPKHTPRVAETYKPFGPSSTRYYCLEDGLQALEDEMREQAKVRDEILKQLKVTHPLCPKCGNQVTVEEATWIDGLHVVFDCWCDECEKGFSWLFTLVCVKELEPICLI